MKFYSFSAITAFKQRIDKNGPYPKKYTRVNTRCWIWTAGLSKGYGQFYYSRKYIYAHRVALELHLKRPLTADECSLHKCDNPACVRPTHLFVGSHLDNALDRKAKDRGASRRNGNCRAITCPESYNRINPNAKLTVKDVLKIRQMYATGHKTLQDIASKYHMTPAGISLIVRRKNWKKV